jgi:GTPase SAR1 family protein
MHIPMNNSHVFISYSRRDSTVMLRCVAFMRKQGINIWLDNEKLIPGTPIWEEEIEKALKSASAVIVLMSPDSKKSAWVRREIALADQYQKRIFPVLVHGDEESSISLRLVGRQYVDIREDESKALRSLRNTIRLYLDELSTQDLVAAKVAVIGEFCRGKTTFINALVGKEVLESNFLPNTYITTILRYGLPEGFRVNYTSKPSWTTNETHSSNLLRDLSKFSSTDILSDYLKNTKSSKNSIPNDIESIEVWCDSGFLNETKLTVIDTPGLGMFLDIDNHISNYILPHADAYIYLIQSDPGIAESDVRFLRILRSLEASNNLFTVLSKVDLIESEMIDSHIEFCESVLKANGISNTTVFPVSARLALEGDYLNSGFPEFILVLKRHLSSLKTNTA